MRLTITLQDVGEISFKSNELTKQLINSTKQLIFYENILFKRTKNIHC